MPAFGDYQNEIYFKGLHGVKPKLPVNFSLLEQKARAALPDNVLSYVAGGCGNEHTQNANVAAFERWGLIPRMMVDGSKRDMSIELFGQRWPSPLFMAPIGVLGICAQDGHGDLAAAKAAAITGVPMVASTLSNDPHGSGRQGHRQRDRALSSSTRRTTFRWPKASCIAPRRRDSRGSW